MQVEARAHSHGAARNLAAGSNRDGAVAVTEVEQLPLDHRGDRLHQARLPRPAESLPGEEARPVDAEEHPAHPAGAHRLDVDPLRQHASPRRRRKGDVARLVQHRLANGEQHDHHPHAERKPEEEKDSAELPHQQMAEREGG